ncbi:MAG: hypothetical protein AAB472_03315 [Patescibacteria group bacterium]
MPPEQPQENTAYEQQEESLWKKQKIAVVCGALATLVVLALFFFEFKSRLILPGDNIVISAGYFRVSPLYIVNKATTTPVLVSYGGVEKKAFDMLILSDGSKLYSLREESDVPSLNIYRVDIEGTVTQLTNSPTVKFNISADPSETHIIYEEMVAKDDLEISTTSSWDIQQLDLNTRAVEHITSGVQPRYIRSGALLVGQKNGVVLYHPENQSRKSASSTPVLSSKVYSLYAVSAEGEHVAAYNTKTGAVDVFDVTVAGTLSYAYSSKPEHQPSNISFSDGEPVSVESTPSPRGVVYTVTRYSVSRTEWNITGPQGLIAQRLIYASH